MSDVPAPFDYGQLAISARVIAFEAAGIIRQHGRQAAESIIGIGEQLVRVKEALGHGHYLQWIQAEFGWSERSARRFVEVYDAFKSANLADIAEIDVSALYLLAAPSTPEPVRAAAKERAAAGERVTHTSVKGQIAEERARRPEPEPEPAADEEEEDGAPETGPVDEEEIDDNKFILERIAAAFELVERYKGCKALDIAGLVDPKRRRAAARKAKRLENWLHEVGYWLERL
jgi:Protein of unknown function (DUF3102)